MSFWLGRILLNSVKCPSQTFRCSSRICRLKIFKERVAQRLLKEITDRIGFMVDVGLGYLTLSRQTRTLSSGEYQRITLARALGSALTETLYVLDEPSIGLHARDTHRLLRALQQLRKEGNTVVVVEHDPDMIKAADEIIDLGPGAGKQGAMSSFREMFESLLKDEDSITARYLRNGMFSSFQIGLIENRRDGSPSAMPGNTISKESM